jgi:hypothetical protein
MPRDVAFCRAWLEHFDLRTAWDKAGFSAKNKGWARIAENKLKRFSEYLKPLQQAKTQKVAERLVIKQSDVLDAMARKAIFNPLDFIERSKAPPKREIAGTNGAATSEIAQWNGEQIYGERLKPISKLTREQAMTVELVSDATGMVSYRLPGAREQHQYLVSLGRQFGMFSEKVIMERRQEEQRLPLLQLENVPTHQLHDLMLRLLPLVGSDFAQSLGLTDEEIAEAAAIYGNQGTPQE